MRRLGEEPYMNREKRDDILLQIATGRSREARVKQVLSGLPPWTDRPFLADQETFDETLKTYQAANPLVSAVESRLTTEPGPVWRDFSPEERSAYENWTASLDKLQGYVDSYFPTDQQQQIMLYVCMAIAVGSFVLPMFLGNDDNGKLQFPFDIKPVPLPPGMAPRPGIPSQRPISSSRPTYRPMTPSSIPRESFMPTSFSKIPASSSAIPVKAEILRPAAASTPWRSQAPAGSLPAPGFRSFVKPLGPSEPVSTKTAPVAPGTQIPTPSYTRIYPKFRSQ